MNTNRQTLWLHAIPWLLAALSLGLVLSQVQRPAALVQVWVPWAETGALAMVLTAIILSGGIDLSVGSTVALCVMVLGVLWHDWGLSMGVAMAAALATGLACGAFNGALVTLGLSPLVTTLATMALYRGLALSVSGARRITAFPAEYLAWDRLAGIPSQICLLIVVALLTYVIVHHTRFGRMCFALGDNRRAAQFAAHPVSRVEWSLYAGSGLVAGLVAVLYTIDRDAAVPDAHRGVELQAIACVVVGGTSIKGGRGGVLRTLLGLAVIANLDIGLQFLGTRLDALTAESRLVVIGLLLIAVATWNERLAGSLGRPSISRR